ncbi:hypothetical protein H5407_20995 [Mitsuaria sp. WAJ17]|nr:hypothetical protein [Mitsuaria sp. WAJ17]
MTTVGAMPASAAASAEAQPPKPSGLGQRTAQGLIAGEVGAEGIAPHLQRLIDGGEDWQLFSALRVLGDCRRAASELQMMHTLMERAPGYSKGQSMLDRARANHHACQSIPSALWAQESALYRRVISHGMPGAAPGYLEMLLASGASPPAETLQEARAWVYAEAVKGGILAIRMAADGDASNPALSAVEQRAMWHVLQVRQPPDGYGGKEATIAVYDQRFHQRWPQFSLADEQKAEARARELLAGMPPLPGSK